MSSIRLALKCAVMALVFAQTNAVFAQAKSVTLLGVSGVDGPRFATALERDLAELYDFVPGDRYKSKAAAVGHLGASPEDVRIVARAVNVDAVIGGAVVGVGRNRRLLIAVREGASGRVIARGRYDLSGRTLPLVREKVASDLVRALDRVRPIGSAPAVVETKPQAGEPQNGEAETGEPGESATASGSEAAAEDVTPSAAVAKVAQPTRAVSGVFGGVGMSLLTRSLGFDVPSAPGYSGGTVAGIRAEGAVFPLSLSAELAEEHPVLASFGFTGFFEYVFDFTSSTKSGTAAGHASRWNISFVGRAPLGHHARGGMLTIDTGVQQMSWGSAAPVDIGVPDVRYDMITGGLGWEKALGTRWAILSLRVGYDGVFSAGDIQGDTQYGPGNGWGIGASGGLSAWPKTWLWLRAAGNYERIALSFSGSGTRFAKAATDEWIGGTLEVGFAL
jgi:hypothetical protein